jgi:hypothetical protein
MEMIRIKRIVLFYILNKAYSVPQIQYSLAVNVTCCFFLEQGILSEMFYFKLITKSIT